MKAEELEAVRKPIEDQEQEGSTMVGLLFVSKGKDMSSGWTLIFPQGITPEFQAHVLESLGIDPARVSISVPPPPVPEPFSQREDEIAYGSEDHEDEEGNDFHTKFGGDP